ncbi:hypothetical protein GCM10014715_25690 [Streptomyces spiralis]|uniref:Uncharacterized protein n=1 Tax=Streptomyces spiralis TaxID=66376 RepID=A0A918ZUD3_9ACTN|nr:hypothetical protein GCM10014715_25690 [Streptomyces spiralis]
MHGLRFFLPLPLLGDTWGNLGLLPDTSRSAVPLSRPEASARQPLEADDPLYTGTAIPIDSWRSRMWLDTWV